MFLIYFKNNFYISYFIFNYSPYLYNYFLKQPLEFLKTPDFSFLRTQNYFLFFDYQMCFSVFFNSNVQQIVLKTNYQTRLTFS